MSRQVSNGKMLGAAAALLLAGLLTLGIAVATNQCRWPIALTALLCLVPAGLIAGLRICSPGRQEAEAEALLIAEISSKFVNLPSAEVDGEILDAERRICELLHIDLVAFWQWSNQGKGTFNATHVYSLKDGAQPPLQLNQDDYPWVVEQMLANRPVMISSLAELPEEASRDRESVHRLGIKSSLTLPLSVGGAHTIGVLALNVIRAERDWPAPLVARLHLVAEIFANALERKRADQVLHESEARYTAGADLVGLGHYEVDFVNGTFFCDDRLLRIAGIPESHRHDHRALEFWIEHLHPDDRKHVLVERERLHSGTEDRVTIEYRYLHPDRGQRWLSHEGRIEERGEDGRGIRSFGVMCDITERRQAELEARELRENLAHADRVSLLGQLASALAHELSQPLGAILRNTEAAELILNDPSPDLGELRAIVTDILLDDKRAGQVIDRLRSLLKRRILNLQPIDLSELIIEVSSLVRTDAAMRHIELDCPPIPELPPVLGDRIHLQQVLLNLLVNSMEAIDDSRQDKPWIEIAVRQVDAEKVEVRVCDNGPGIPRESHDQLFEAFFTTKDSGMGIGLSVSKTIIEAHQGRLWEEGNPHGGACFRFTLPVAPGEAGAAPPPPAQLTTCPKGQ